MCFWSLCVFSYSFFSVIGAGIFISPSVVATQVSSGGLVIVTWSLAGIVSLIGEFGVTSLVALQYEHIYWDMNTYIETKKHLF